MTGLLAAAGLVAALAGPVMAQPVPLNRRTGGILVSDLNTNGIYLGRDLNGDGDALAAGESNVFFDASNAGGLPFPDAVFGLAADRSGAVFAAEFTSKSVYRLLDTNNDGDANDTGEAVKFFDDLTANSLVFLGSCNGVAIDSVGAVYVSSVASIGRPGDFIARLRDLDGDGTANQGGEAVKWWDMDALNGVPGSAPKPFDVTAIGDTIYVVDADPTPRVVYRARDVDGNGQIDAGEFNIFIKDGDFGVAVSQGMATDGTSLYFLQRTGTTTPARPVYRVTDANASGTIDAASEVQLLWSRDNVPAGRTMNTGAAIATGPDGQVAILSTGSGTASNVFLLSDRDGDGDFRGTGVATPADESSTFLRDGLIGTFLQTGRALAFYGRACGGDYNGDGFQNLDDLGDFITDFYTTPPIPGGVQDAAPTYTGQTVGFAGYCPQAPLAASPYLPSAYQERGYRVGYSPDGSNTCPQDPSQPFPNLDNLNDYITFYYSTFGC